MAGKGPKSDVLAQPAQLAKPVVPRVATSAPVPVVAKTAAVKPPAPVVPKLVAKPAVLAKATAVAPAAVPAAVVPTAPRPVFAAPTPVVAVMPQLAPAPELPAPVAAPAAIVQKEIKTMATTFQSATETAQAQAQTLFGDVNDRAKTALEKSSKAIEEFNDFSKGNVEALVESSKIAAKGAEDIAKYTTDYVKASVEKANAAAKQFAAVKSPTELFKLQSDHAKEAIDAVVAETAKFTENYLKLLGEIAQPISNRVALAAEKIKIAA